jgi:sigma-E factor negative regulatory protein RseC
MIIEIGRIVSVEPDSVWVETVQRTTCNSCRAEPGCGQSMMAKLSGHTSYLRVLLQGRDSTQYRLGDEVQIGVPEAVVANGSLFAYLLPLLSMLLFAGIAHHSITHELFTVLAAFTGLILGGIVVRLRGYQTRNNSDFQPVLVDDHQPVKLVSQAC